MERREPGPSAALCVEGTTALSDGYSRATARPSGPPPSRPPTAPIGYGPAFERGVAARHWLPPDGAVLLLEGRCLPAPVKGRAGRI